MKKIASTALLLVVFMLALAPTLAVQAASLPVGGCPQGFELMPVMTHDMDEHTHVGLKVDLNGDGYLCMYKATSTIHVHVDNFVVAP